MQRIAVLGALAMVMAGADGDGCGTEEDAWEDPRCDFDQDGYLAPGCDGDDCDDSRADVHPGVEAEVCNGVDDDCNPSTRETGEWADLDGDGYGPCDSDCDNTDPSVVPVFYADADGDGYAWGEGDCNDCDPAIHWGGVEIAGNGMDDDCDGFLDEATQ